MQSLIVGSNRLTMRLFDFDLEKVSFGEKEKKNQHIFYAIMELVK